MLATTLRFVTNILYLLATASGDNIQKMSPISKFCHQQPKIVTNVHLSPMWPTKLNQKTSMSSMSNFMSLFVSQKFLIDTFLPINWKNKSQIRYMSISMGTQKIWNLCNYFPKFNDLTLATIFSNFQRNQALFKALSCTMKVHYATGMIL